MERKIFNCEVLANKLNHQRQGNHYSLKNIKEISSKRAPLYDTAKERHNRLKKIDFKFQNVGRKDICKTAEIIKVSYSKQNLKPETLQQRKQPQLLRETPSFFDGLTRQKEFVSFEQAVDTQQRPHLKKEKF